MTSEVINFGAFLHRVTSSQLAPNALSNIFLSCFASFILLRSVDPLRTKPLTARRQEISFLLHPLAALDSRIALLGVIPIQTTNTATPQGSMGLLFPSMKQYSFSHLSLWMEQMKALDRTNLPCASSYNKFCLQAATPRPEFGAMVSF